MLTLFLKIQFVIFIFHKTSGRSIQNSTEGDTEDKKVKILEERIDNLTAILEQVRLQDDEHVLFFVRLSRAITLNRNSIVRFDEVEINEGNHFNPGDGIFVAPASGVYQFSWTTLTTTAKLVETELMVENVTKETLHIALTSNEGSNSGTKVVFCKVKKGDHVWIQTSHVYDTNYFYVANRAKSSFAGILIHRF